MSEQKLPNTESADVINKAIAHDIVMKSIGKYGASAATMEEFAKEVANLYVEVLDIVSKRQPPVIRNK